MTDTITKPMQGLAAYLRHASRDVHVGSKSRKTLLDWAREVEAALAAPPKGLFVDMIAEHPGLAEELKAQDAEFDAKFGPQPVKQAADYQLGWQRYEKVRKLNVHQFSELFQRGLKGERFDDMVDELPGATQ